MSGFHPTITLYVVAVVVGNDFVSNLFSYLRTVFTLTPNIEAIARIDSGSSDLRNAAIFCRKLHGSGVPRLAIP